MNLKNEIIRKCHSHENLTSKRKIIHIPNKTNANGSHYNNEVEHRKSTKVRSCLLSKTKSPIPKLKDLPIKIQNIEERDHIRTNIIRVKNVKKRQRPNIAQDSCDGHRQNLDQAGLELKYVFKKEYGRTPQYLRRRRLLCEQKKGCTKEDPPNTRLVDEEEKQAVLNGLKTNFKEVEKRLLSLPVITDTLSKQRRKLYLENLLQKLEQDIEMLENNDIIVFKD